MVEPTPRLFVGLRELFLEDDFAKYSMMATAQISVLQMVRMINGGFSLRYAVR